MGLSRLRSSTLGDGTECGLVEKPSTASTLADEDGGLNFYFHDNGFAWFVEKPSTLADGTEYGLVENPRTVSTLADGREWVS
jgi:hypothetical protein